MADNLLYYPASYLIKPPCVYFMVRDQRVIYVGQSVNLAARLTTHNHRHEFDHVFYLPCPREKLDEVEMEFIRTLCPTLNVQGKLREDMRP